MFEYAGVVAFILLILVPVGIGVFVAERRSRGLRRSMLRRGKDERHAISRLIVGMTRWPGGGGGGGGA